MKRAYVSPLLLSLVLATTATLVQAQPTPHGNIDNPVPAKMDRAEFLKMFVWDPVNDMWVMRPGFAAPESVKSRAQVKAERDVFLKNNHFDNVTSTWIPLGGKPRDITTMTREQVRTETANFLRTHRWDEMTEQWIIKGSAVPQ
jgi:hypothetical protein